jgi:hypothetical protein
VVDRGCDEVLDVFFSTDVGCDRKCCDRCGVAVAGFLV